MIEFSGLIVDSILAFLLVATIIVSIVVYRKLSTIRAGQDELRILVDRLNAAVMEAQRSVSGLKISADEIEGRLKVQTQSARSIMDELSLMTEAGNNLANRIEKGLSGASASKAAPKTTDKKQQEEILAALREAR